MVREKKSRDAVGAKSGTEEERSVPTDFIRAMVADDQKSGKYGGRVVTRFPPEPNGYLHIGHAKSICLNFGIAEENEGGVCNLRFDDTNPETEEVRYAAAIQEDVRWLGFDLGDRLYYASDYFEQLYEYAVQLIREGNAYVDSQSEEEIRASRGTVMEPGVESPHRNRSVEENLKLFERMRAGDFEDGTHVLRAKIDMSSPNMLMRDPVLYRIRHAHHYRTGDKWPIYPLYDFTHCLSDAIEGITHSLCTLEFENNRELYDWVLDAVGIEHPRTEQTEFARLNLDYTVLSKRKLVELVDGGHVSGWDDPRMPTIAGLRRRGVTPDAIRAFCDLIGVAKVNSRIDVGKLEYAIRDDLNVRVPRVMCVARPLKVVIINYPEGQVEELEAPYYPHDVPLEGSRMVPFSGELYIESDDFREEPPKGFYRLAPGREVRLRYAYFIKCVEVVKDPDSGEVLEVRCTYDPETRGGSAKDGRKVKGTLHWVSAAHSVPAELRMYDRLFMRPDPDDVPEGVDFKDSLNPDSLQVLSNARIEPSVAGDPAGSRYQFERIGYFCSDPVDSKPGTLVYNRTVGLRDSWAKVADEEPRPRNGLAKGKAAKKKKRSAGKSPAPPKRSTAAADNPEAQARLTRYVNELGVDREDAKLLASDKAVALFFEEAVATHANAGAIANWVVNDVFGQLKERQLDELPFGGGQLGALVALIDAGIVTRNIAKEIFVEMANEGGEPEEIMKRKDLSPMKDLDTLGPMIERLIAEHPDKVQQYRAGRTGLLGFFVGQVMKESAGRADPEVIRELLVNQLA